MTTINPVAFQGNAGVTKDGKVYNKTNAGKNIGTAVGLGAGYSALLLPEVAAKIATRSVKATNLLYAPAAARGLQVGVVLLGAALGRILGAIPDAIINNSRAKNAKYL